MTLAKFLSLLDSRALFFSQPKQFEDKFEGSFREPVLPLTADKDQPLRESAHTATGIRTQTAISCWHMNEYESAAMWAQYVTNNEGIAIRSTVQRLQHALNFEGLGDVYMGAINYYPYQARDDSVWSLFHKRESFAHEHEFRVLVVINDLPKADELGGIQVPADLNILIERIYIAPNTRPWFTDLIKSVAQKYNVDADVIRSDLDKDPIF
ncbi:MAG: DUF2971 domain-containing protein [Phototrophicales bacterium]